MTHSLPNILVTGGDGQLASAIKASIDKQQTIYFCTRNEADITSTASLESVIKQYKPAIIINTAAYTAVDKAEQDQENAFNINQIGAGNLATLCNKHDILLMHLSTDYVFDGLEGDAVKSTPYKEKDPTVALNVYGQSKLAGEIAIREACDKHIILRVSSVFSEYGNNFFRTMLRLAREREEINIVDDQLSCPTYAGDIAKTVLQMIKNPAHLGTYHYCSSKPVSWHGFASYIIDMLRQHKPVLVKNIHAVRTIDYPSPTKRPHYSVLDCNKIKKDYAIQQPSWESAVKRIIK